MFTLDVTTVVTGFVFIFLIYLFLRRDKGSYPPGPRGYPLLGNLPQLKPAVYESLEKWRKQHGDMFIFYLGGKPVLALCSYELIHEAYVTMNDKFLDRPNLYVLGRIFRGFGVIFAKYGDTWKRLRKMALVTMRDLGVGKTTLEEKIHEEVSAIFKVFEENGDQPFTIRGLLQQAMVNIICSVNFGKRYEYNDGRMQRLLRLLDEFFANNPMKSPLSIFPWLRFFMRGLERPIKVMEETRSFVAEQVSEHRATFDPDNIRDFIDVFLKSESQKTEPNNYSVRPLEDDNLFQMIHDLFSAGSETAATSLSWALLFLIRYPDVQERMYSEIVAVVGEHRQVTMADKPKMVYTDAILKESLRVGNTIPIIAPHATIEDTMFRGYLIPKGTFVMASSWSVHHDPKHWPHPYAFNPDRWIGKDGKLIRHEAFVPFSLGMRRCLGEQLANMEMFIILTSLVQRFEFRVPSGHAVPSEDSSAGGLTRRPSDYLLQAIKR